MAICHDNTVESGTPTRIGFRKRITRRWLICHETQAHLMIDPSGNFRHFSQWFSGSPIGVTTHEIDLEWMRGKLRGQ